MYQHLLQTSSLLTVPEERSSLQQRDVLATLSHQLLVAPLSDCVPYRGARSHSGCPISHRALDLVLSEGRVPSP